MPVTTRSKTATASDADATGNTSTPPGSSSAQGSTGNSVSTQQGQHQPSSASSIPSSSITSPTSSSSSSMGDGQGLGGVAPDSNNNSSNPEPGTSSGAGTSLGASSSASTTPTQESANQPESPTSVGDPTGADDATTDINHVIPPPTVQEETMTELDNVPPNWPNLMLETTQSLELLKCLPLDKDSPEFQAISALVAPLEIGESFKICNPDLWARYSNAKRDLLKSKSEDLATLSKLGLGEEEYMLQAHSCLNYNRDPLLTSYSVNEVLLLHCTQSGQHLARICEEGLDERLGGANGTRLGKGIYFADSSLKAIQYDGTGCAMLIFAVLLGDCLSVADNPNNTVWLREPAKDKMQMRRHNDVCFGSITGTPALGGGFNEYVIFNRDRCYPLYFLTYKKPGTLPTTPTGAQATMPTIAWRAPPGCSVPMPNQNVDRRWASFAANIYAKMDPSADPSPPGEACLICTEEFETFSSSPGQWKELPCSHRLCQVCYRRIETVGTTMAGVSHTFFRCPFCQHITGTAVGDCPNGLMLMKNIPDSCEGFEGCGSIEVEYIVDDGIHYLNRVAYFPDNLEGNGVLELIKIAWDRRLCFTIGMSGTTGSNNVLIWNIHHKTELGGGVEVHGYPDPGYMDRVKWELAAYGIQ